MLVLGIESSCDETGVALYDSERGLLAHALHSQIAMHNEYGGVVPELASRDHIRRVLPLAREVLQKARIDLPAIDAVAYTKGPGLAGALLVGASVGAALAFALKKPAIGVHHMEGHLLSPLLSTPAPQFPFLALLVSGGHTLLIKVENIGRYTLLGETLDDAAGEAFDKTAKMLGLGYPGGAALSKLAEQGNPQRFTLPRPMLHTGDFNFSFSGLKTAALTLYKKHPDEESRADIARAFQDAIIEVLVKKSLLAAKKSGLKRIVVAGGVSANKFLRQRLSTAARGMEVFYPELQFCSDNGAMIAFAGAMRLAHKAQAEQGFGVKPRWDLDYLAESC